MLRLSQNVHQKMKSAGLAPSRIGNDPGNAMILFALCPVWGAEMRLGLDGVSSLHVRPTI